MRRTLLLLSLSLSACGSAEPSAEGTSDGGSIEETAAPACTEGATETIACGKCGSKVRRCTSGVFVEDDVCRDERGVCEPGRTETASCSGGASRARTCTSTCTWDEWSGCPTPKGWREMASSTTAGVSGRHRHRAFWTGKEMLVFGGAPGGGLYDPKSDTWRAMANAPSGFDGGLSAWDGKRLWVVSGLKVASWDLATDTWSKPSETDAPVAAPNARTFALIAWSSSTNEVIVWGGYTSRCPCNHADGAAWDPLKSTWRKIADAPLGGRGAYDWKPSVVWNGTRLFVYGGGASSGKYADAAAYDPKSDSWELLPPAPVATSVDVHGFLLDPSRPAFWGGQQFGGVHFNYPTNGGNIWDDATKSWSAIAGPPGERPVDALYLGAAWSDGKSFSVFGGQRYFAPIDAGWTFDEASKTWIALPASGMAPRVDATAVWTGSEAIVWGGRANVGSKVGYSDGKIYRP